MASRWIVCPSQMLLVTSARPKSFTIISENVTSSIHARALSITSIFHHCTDVLIMRRTRSGSDANVL